jgi:P-type E1-E2 ATPase
MMLVGEMLENLTIARADNALKELASLVPDTVILRRDGEDVVVPIQAVRTGDRVLVRPGGRIPVDGRVRSGTAAVDQAAITGESMPWTRDQRQRLCGHPCSAGRWGSGGKPVRKRRWVT